MTGPTNDEFFRFLEDDLSFSLFRRSDTSLISFKETIEFVLLPEGTLEGPEEGLLFEGVARMPSADWCGLIDGFVIATVETRVDPAGGMVSRVFRTNEAGRRVNVPLDPGAEAVPRSDPSGGAAARVREELRAGAWRYVWMGDSRRPDSAGWLLVHARRIACRGADKGGPAALIFRAKLRAYFAGKRPSPGKKRPDCAA